MSESGNEISFRLRVRHDSVHQKWWLGIPLNIGEFGNLLLVPNSVASRSVITPAAFQRLWRKGLIGADIYDFPSGRMSCLLRDVSIVNQAVPDPHVRIRDADELLGTDDKYLMDGYIGLDYLFGAFASITVDTQKLQVRLGLRPSSGTR